MGLMTYGAQIAAGAGSLWDQYRLLQGFANTTLWSIHVIVNALNRYNTFIFNSWTLFSKKPHYDMTSFMQIVTRGLHDISLSISQQQIAHHFVSIFPHCRDLCLSAHSVCPGLACRLAVIFSWPFTDDIRLLMALQGWKVEVMGCQMFYCEFTLSRRKR